jgi:hypothetical protein
MVAGIAKAALGVADVEALKAADLGGKTVAETDHRQDRHHRREHDRCAAWPRSKATCGVLCPQRRRAGMGKIGVLVALTGGDEAFGKQVAMHVAAANPASLNEADLDPASSRRNAGPDRHRPRIRQARAGDREDDRRPDEEVPGRGHAAEPGLRHQPRPDRRPPPPRKPAPRSPASSASKWAKASRRRKKTSPPRSPRPPGLFPALFVSRQRESRIGTPQN